MKHLSSYKEIEEICDKYNIKNWFINEDGLVDVNGDVDIKLMGLIEFPLKFGRVSGSFRCDNNKLTNLEGAPKEAGGNFHCYNNNLTSLEGVPKEVGGGFSCAVNNLTSLEGAPKEVSGDFICSYNKLTSLEGAPKKVVDNFYCNGNKLTSLEGTPKEVGVDFFCHNNELITLEGIPFHTKYLNCYGNPIYEIWKFINDIKYLEEFVEVYDVVRPGKVVILEYLNDIRKLMDKEPVKREEILDGWEILDI